jgi:hypothetical protein
MSNQTFLTDVPYNTSFLQTSKFTFVIPELPFAKYFCQSVNLPGVSTSAAEIETPFSKMKLHGDKLVYGPLEISFLVDEDIRVWEETYDWIRSLTFPHEFDEYKRRGIKKVETNYHDGVLTILNNANLENVRIIYNHLHPIGLTGIQFQSTENADLIMTATATFAYDTFKIERL